MSDDAPKIDTPVPETVPASRLAEVVAERNAARRDLADAQARAGKAGEWEATAASTATELASERAARSEERDLYRAGLVDDEAHVVARALYAAQPPDIRPKSLGDYLASLRAEGATVPRALAGYLGEPGKPPAAPVVQPRPPAGAGKGTPNGASVTAESLRAAREHYQRTGDKSQMVSLAAARRAAT